VRSNADIPAEANARTPNGGADTAPNVAAVAKETAANTKAPEVTPDEQPSVFNALALNLKVSVPDDLVLKGQDIKTGSGGTSLGNMSVTVGGDVQSRKTPATRCVCAAISGRSAGSTRSRVDGSTCCAMGRIRFVGTDEINPLLDLQARRVIQGVEAFINVRGTMTMPELSFRSSPRSKKPTSCR
jgi:autotransporter translocation and assembly factor TamB